MYSLNKSPTIQRRSYADKGAYSFAGCVSKQAIEDTSYRCRKHCFKCYVNAGDPEQTFAVGGLSEGTYNITAKQNDGSSAQITYINVYYPINGDVNKDGYVDKADVKMLLDHITGISTITDGTALYNADCDGIEGIDLRDAIYILKTE